jgi:hypothetical protein
VVPNVYVGLSLLMNGEWWGRESACTQRYGCAPRSSRGAKWGQIQSFKREGTRITHDLREGKTPGVMPGAFSYLGPVFRAEGWPRC